MITSSLPHHALAIATLKWNRSRRRYRKLKNLLAPCPVVDMERALLRRRSREMLRLIKVVLAHEGLTR